MGKVKTLLIIVISLGLLLLLGMYFAPVGEKRASITAKADVETGKVLLRTAGCYACHTQTEQDGVIAFSGGPALDTPFGVFHAPNITSSETHGIGDWTLDQFEAALRQGRNPQGHSYYPAFPFLSYRSLTDTDVASLFAALQVTEPFNQDGKPHELSFPFNIRMGMKPWRWMFATTKSLSIDQSTPEGRGRYLVDVVGHCGECHNSRNAIGAFIPPYLGGNQSIPGGDAAPGIHGAALERMDWTEDDLYYFLSDGMLTDGDYVGGSMVEVIDYSTSQMTDSDRKAIATYLFSLR